MLRAAGLDFEVAPARVDEAALKQSMRAAGASARDAATALAELKAGRPSASQTSALVIGADQILSCGADWFDKPADMAAARAQLRSLRGKQHVLASAVAVARGGGVIWRHAALARLTMREFSDGFLDHYLARVGEAALQSVGAYQLEGPGIQLFARIEGDYFGILGLPLLPLLDFLRASGEIET
jgi:septum formation protein